MAKGFKKIDDLTPIDGVLDEMQLEVDINGEVAHKITASQLKTYTSGTLQAQINQRVPTGRLIETGPGLTGGGNLNSDRSINLDLMSLSTDPVPSVDDFLFTFDVSEGTLRKVEIGSLPGGGSGGGGVTHHGQLSGLSNDDHSQYSLASGTRWTTTQTANRVPISNSSGHLVVSSVTDTELGYLSGVTSAIQTQLTNKADSNHTHDAGDITSGTFDNARISPGNVTQHEEYINHGGISGVVANQHIDHSTVSINAGIGLSGGGNLTASRTIDLDFNSLTTENTIDDVSDTIAFYDTSANAYRKTTIANLGLGGDSGLLNAYSQFTDGTTTATSSGGDVFKFRSANNLLAIAVQNDDATHGDNLLLTVNQGNINHGSIGGLSNDDHSQYSLASGTRWTTTQTANRVPISNGSGHLVVSSVTSTELGHLSGVTSAIQTQINGKANSNHTHDAGDITSGTFDNARISPGNVTQHEEYINHGGISGVVANQHIDHSTVSISAGIGLSGGGNLTANRTIALDFNSLTTENTIDDASDTIAFYDASASSYRKTTIANLGLGGGGGLSNAYSQITDGTTTATSSGGDVFKFRSANNLLAIAVQNNDATHGDNLLLTVNQGNINHGSIGGLSNDDHSQYSLASGTRWTTTQTANRVPISNSSGHLVVSSVTSTELGHLSGVTSAIQTQINGKANSTHTHAAEDITSGTFNNARVSSENVTQHQGSINHNLLSNYVANQHIDHSTVSISAGTGLSGGGNITANRTISLDFNSLTTENTIDDASDTIAFYDASASAYRKTAIANLGTGGSSTFSGLTDTPSSYSGQAGKALRVNSGATAIEFFDVPTGGGVGVGPTLPESPSEGEFFLHTPTGRKWLMQWDGSEWSAIASYGVTIIYCDDSLNGSTNLEDGTTTSNSVSLEWICSKLPFNLNEDVYLYLANRAFNSTDYIDISRKVGKGIIRIVGGTTVLVPSLFFNSGSAPFQSMNMSSAVTAGSEGDIVRQIGGDSLSLSFDGALFPEEDATWVLLSRSGNNLQIPGGLGGTPNTNTNFEIRSRNTTMTYRFNINTRVSFYDVNFLIPSGVSATINRTQSNVGTVFIGCKFEFSGSGDFRDLAGASLAGCYFLRNNNDSHIMCVLSSLPSFVQRCLFKSTSNNSVNGAHVFSTIPATIPGLTMLSGNRFWHTQSGSRIGIIQNHNVIRCDYPNISNQNTYVVIGGGSLPAWTSINCGGVVRTNSVNVTGTSGGVCTATSPGFTSS